MAQQQNPAQTYEDFLVPLQFRIFAEDLVARAAPQPGERVLDLACATGIVARLIAPRVAPGGGVTGLDVSPAMLGVARERAAAEGVDATWDQGDAAALPYADGTFDLVVCQQGLQYFPDKPAALRELRRVLAPGGRALLSVWSMQPPFFDAYNRVTVAHLDVPAGSIPFSLTDAGAVRALLEGAGFATVAFAEAERTIRQPSLGDFVRRGTQARAAVVPALAALPPGEIEAKADGIAAELAPLVRDYLDGGALAYPMRTNVALVRR